jgi:hypothetical protein
MKVTRSATGIYAVASLLALGLLKPAAAQSVRPYSTGASASATGRIGAINNNLLFDTVRWIDHLTLGPGAVADPNAPAVTAIASGSIKSSYFAGQTNVTFLNHTGFTINPSTPPVTVDLYAFGSVDIQRSAASQTALESTLASGSCGPDDSYSVLAAYPFTYAVPAGQGRTVTGYTNGAASL